VEKIATEALGVKVTIGSMDVVLQEKLVSVSSVRVSNPKGFSKPYAVSVDTAQILLGDLSKGLIDFRSIDVFGTKVFLEVQEGTTNLHRLKQGIQGRSAASEEGEPVKVMIRKFSIDGAELTPSVTLISQQDLKPVQVSPVTLSNIGVKEKGIPAHDAVARIVQSLLKAFGKEAGNAGFYEGLSSDALKEIGQAQFGEIQKQVDKIGEDLKNIFN